MSANFPGNPYAAHSGVSDDACENNGHWGIAQATMALAYEQRTATLLQFLMWEPTRGVDSPGAELQKQIVQRLGLDQGATS